MIVRAQCQDQYGLMKHPVVDKLRSGVSRWMVLSRRGREINNRLKYAVVAFRRRRICSAPGFPALPV